MGEQQLSQEIISLLEEACEDDISNYEVVVHEDPCGGQGYMGEMVFVSLKNKNGIKSFHLAIKQTIPASDSANKSMMEAVFFNEIQFYKIIWRELEKFQENFPGPKQFGKIAKFYCSCSTPGKEKLVMENMKFLNFKMFPRDGTFDDVHTKLLMKSYGQFHGVSAAFREHYPEDYNKLTKDLKNSVEYILIGMQQVSGYVVASMKRLYDIVEDENIKEKLKVYNEKGPQITIESLKYNGKNAVVNHGDCWSNNMMFQYDINGTPLDLVLLDFQLCRSGSVVSDLSYLLYSGVTKEIFGKLDHYLKIYHGSFSDTLKHFNLDPSKIFTFEDLKKEWKDHCAFGFVMGQLLLGNKFSKSYEKRSFVDLVEKGGLNAVTEEEHSKLMETYETDITRLNEICLDLVQHLYENDYL